MLAPQNCAITLIDHQPEMALGVNTIGTGELRNNVAGLAKPSDVYDIPAVLTSIGREYNGPLFEEITLSMNTILSRLS